MSEENVTEIIKLIRWNFPDEYNTILFESGRELLTRISIEELHSILGRFILRKEVKIETDITGKIITNIKLVPQKHPLVDCQGNIKEIEF